MSFPTMTGTDPAGQQLLESIAVEHLETHAPFPNPRLPSKALCSRRPLWRPSSGGSVRLAGRRVSASNWRRWGRSSATVPSPTRGLSRRARVAHRSRFRRLRRAVAQGGSRGRGRTRPPTFARSRWSRSCGGGGPERRIRRPSADRSHRHTAFRLTWRRRRTRPRCA